MKNKAFIAKLISGIAGIALGALLILVDGSAILSIISKIIGVILLVANVPGVIKSVAELNSRLGRVELIGSLIGCVIGVVMLFIPSAAISVATVIAGVWFIVLPIVDILSAQYKTEQLKSELPELLVGVALIVVGPSAMVGAVLKIVGGAIIFFSALSVFFQSMG